VSRSRTRSQRSRRHGGWLFGAIVTAGALLSPVPARGACAPNPGPVPAAILWTYPDASTPALPPDAVFWVVGRAGVVSVEVDGVPLEPHRMGVAARQQFDAPAPLAEGEHELVVRVEGTYSVDGVATSDERRLRFDVTADAAETGELRVTGVDSSAPANAERPSSYPPEYDSECSEGFSVESPSLCNDTLSGVTRVDFEVEGQPIAYLARNEYLLPARCRTFWSHEAGLSPAAYAIAPIWPNGVGERQILPKTDEWANYERCSFEYGSPASRGGSFVALALIAAVLRRGLAGRQRS
jgi:hypothetical protein